MKAMKVTLSTTQPVIPKEDFDVIFFKVPELHEFHHHFHESLKRQVDRWDASRDERLGHHFKMLAQQTKVYAQFLGNYPAALAALHRCTQLYPQFADLTGSIKLRTLKGQTQGQSLSLEDLLHKPVARVQEELPQPAGPDQVHPGGPPGPSHPHRVPAHDPDLPQ
jgi:breakpoint cluster region protein